MNKKGFTLIELLAVIVILAIIALIVTPVILNIIKNAQEGADKRSIEQYAKIIKEDYLERKLKDSSLTLEDYLINFVSETTYDGDKIVCEQHNVVNKEIELKNCTVDGRGYYNYIDGKAVKGETVENNKDNNQLTYDYIFTLKNDADNSNSITPGDEYLVRVKDDMEEGFEAGYTFYVLSTNADGTTNLILDRNLGSVAWYLSEYSWYGPVTAMDYLYEATKDWQNIPNIEVNYADEGNHYGKIITEGNVTKITKIDGTVTAEYENLKARLPKYSEVTGDGKCTTSTGSCPVYLVSHLRGHSIIYNYRYDTYWTSSSGESSYHDYGTALSVHAIGKVDNSNSYDSYSHVDDSKGIRPVIQISIDDRAVTEDNTEIPDEDTSEELNETQFSKDSWSAVIANVKNGNTSVYKVGDEKEITLSGEVAGIYTVRIANNSTPSECSNEGFSQTACGFVIEFVDIITTHPMNSTSTSVGGWKASEMRTYVNETIYNALPTEVKDNIIKTTVVSGHENTGEETNFITTDKLYLLSIKEVYGKEVNLQSYSYDTAAEQTRQLDYYKNIGVTSSEYLGAAKYYNENRNYWWLRSVFTRGTGFFHLVAYYGDWGAHYKSNGGVAPAFRLG